MQAMFYLFTNHGLPPSVYYDAHESDKRLMRSFIALEVEEARRSAERDKA